MPSMVNSDSDENMYGSFSSSSEIPALIEDAAEKVVRDDREVEPSSGDEYRSFPASPDLLALG
jgi:hypothetical protein